MKTFPFLLALAALATFNAPAQVVTVGVRLDQDQYLPGESLPVTVCITNNSGQTLHLGAGQKWLLFNVESANNDFVVTRTDDPPVAGEFALGSSQVATKRVDLAPYFVMTHAGRYRVTATIHIPEWSKDLASPAQEFDIIDGAQIWSQEFGVPAPAGVTNQAPDIRKYVLEEANYLRQQLRMYVLVTDPAGARVFKVTAIGPMVSFSRPEAQLDRLSNLHVIYQSGARSFLYSVIKPDGLIAKQDIYDYVTTRPRLGMDDSGNIVVQGGVRRAKPGELPVVQMPDQVPPAPAPAKKP